MAGIRVSKGINVEVNDDGETIIIPLEDQNLIEKFYGLIGQLDQMSAEAEERRKKKEDELETSRHLIERTKELMKKLDEMFGEECCRKVFGNTVPGPYAIGDFFEQLTPIIQQYADDRQTMINQKYSRNRKGKGSKG